MSPAQCVKVRTDNKLGLRLMAAVGLQQLITSLFLSEGVCLMVGSSRIISSLKVKVEIMNRRGEQVVHRSSFIDGTSCIKTTSLWSIGMAWSSRLWSPYSARNDTSLGHKTGLSFEWYKSHTDVIAKNCQLKLHKEQVPWLWLLWKINTAHHTLMLRLRLLHNLFQVDSRYGTMALWITDWPWHGVLFVHCLLARVNCILASLICPGSCLCLVT